MARRTRAELIAALKEAEEQKRQRRLALEAKEKQATRKLDTRRKIITGAAVLTHASLDPNFAAALRTALDQALTKPADRELLADLLNPAAAPTGTASDAQDTGTDAQGTAFDAQGTASEPQAAQSAPSEQTEHHQG
jgi:hypothetical protein